jgi:uncharacterized membrane protein YqaE (UPF0057 family)
VNYLLAILLPPIAVVAAGGSGREIVGNVLLTLLGWIPGLIHAVYVVRRSEFGG